MTLVVPQELSVALTPVVSPMALFAVVKEAALDAVTAVRMIHAVRVDQTVVS